MILNPGFGGGKGGEGVPAGVICMYSGAQDAIPAGWVLCDGQNGTPDLRGRFVLGAGGSYAVGASGGEETHTLTTSEMPSHNHRIQYSTRNEGPGSYPYKSDFNNLASSPLTSAVSDIITKTGGGSAHNNMPPYYSLCYIMKT